MSKAACFPPTDKCTDRSHGPENKFQLQTSKILLFYFIILYTVSLLLDTDQFVQGFIYFPLLPSLERPCFRRYAFCRYRHDFRLASNVKIERNMSPCGSRGQKMPKTHRTQVRTTPARKPWSFSSEFPAWNW